MKIVNFSFSFPFIKSLSHSSNENVYFLPCLVGIGGAPALVVVLEGAGGPARVVVGGPARVVFGGARVVGPARVVFGGGRGVGTGGRVVPTGLVVVGTGGVLIVGADSGAQYSPCSWKTSSTGQKPGIDSPPQHQINRFLELGSGRKVCRKKKFEIV